MEHPFNSDQFKIWSRFEPDKPENIQGFNVFYLVLVFVYFPNERKNKLQASKIVTFNSYWGIPRRYWFWVIQSIQIVHVDTSSSIRSYIKRQHYPRPDASGESLLRVWHYLDIYSIQLISSIISPRRWIHIFSHFNPRCLMMLIIIGLLKQF